MATKAQLSLNGVSLNVCGGIDIQYNNLNLNQNLQKPYYAFSEASKSVSTEDSKPFDYGLGNNDAKKTFLHLE
jgi:hypothetical protein